MQIKFKTLDEAKIYKKKTIQRIGEIYNGEMIIHLKIKDIDNNEILDELTWFTENTNNNCKFIVHLYEDFSADKIYDLAKILKFNQMLLLENDKYIKNKIYFIKKLNMFFNKTEARFLASILFL